MVKVILKGFVRFMQQIIEWCNSNEGFVSAILALVSLLLSVVAICISISVAKLPFKKKISLAFYTNMGIGDARGYVGYEVVATNIGNRVVATDYVGLGYYKNGKLQRLYTVNRDMNNKQRLEINESCNVKFTKEEFNNIKKQSSRIYAIATDVEGTVFKKRIK